MFLASRLVDRGRMIRAETRIVLECGEHETNDSEDRLEKKTCCF